MYTKGNVNKGMYTKDNVPWNKGKKYSDDFRKGWNRSTEFKNEPRLDRRVPIGIVKVRRKKGNVKRSVALVKYSNPEWIREQEKWVNKSLSKWVIEAREIWSAHYGAIPKGRVIWHIDTDPLNNDLANLECITRKEVMYRNDPKKAHLPKTLPEEDIF